jgi:hypothetical protein
VFFQEIPEGQGGLIELEIQETPGVNLVLRRYIDPLRSQESLCLLPESLSRRKNATGIGYNALPHNTTVPSTASSQWTSYKPSKISSAGSGGTG